MRGAPAFRSHAAVAIGFLWLAAFVLAPFLIVLKISFAEAILAQPPFTPLFAPGGIQVTAANYAMVLGDPLYAESYFGSLRIAAVATGVALLIGLPVAHAMARAPAAWRYRLLVLVIVPFWTSFLIRVYAWIGILKPEGLLNAVLDTLGVVERPSTILGTDAAVILGIVYAYLPFMILPLYASLERMDPALLEATADLGCRPARAFFSVTLPLAAPGVLAGCLLVFVPAVGEFVIPDLLGGSDTLMIGRTLWTEFFGNRDWPLASAVAVVLVAILVFPITLLERRRMRSAP